MRRQLIMATLLWLPCLAAAENGITTLSQQQQFLSQRDQQGQQQRLLDNQQMGQHQGYPLKSQQTRMLPYNGNNNPMQPQMTHGKMLPNGNQPVNPFNQAASTIPQVPNAKAPAFKNPGR